MPEKIKIDTETKLSQYEAGRVKTVLERDFKVRLRYREMNDFTPVEVANIQVCRQKGITPEAIAKAAGRGVE